RHTDLSLEKAQLLGSGEPVEIEEKMSATVAVVGYRDDRDLLQVPRTPFRAGAEVQHADEALIKKVLGLRDDRHHGAYVGLLAGHGIKVYLDINAMVQKHVSVLAKTGGGKSYITGVLIEELMKHHVTCVILDPHGEYASLAEKGKVAHGSERFDVDPRGYREVIQVFSPDVKVSPHARPLKFTLSNLDARDILSLTGGGGKLRQHLTALRKVNKIPPLMLVVEEAHNFCPQVGQVASSKVFRTIASEGRKFGLGILIVTQRAAKVDKNVLSQCNTQIILKVTNPNDLKAI